MNCKSLHSSKNVRSSKGVLENCVFNYWWPQTHNCFISSILYISTHTHTGQCRVWCHFLWSWDVMCFDGSWGRIFPLIGRFSAGLSVSVPAPEHHGEIWTRECPLMLSFFPTCLSSNVFLAVNFISFLVLILASLTLSSSHTRERRVCVSKW